jgi:hypothetical protein
MSEGIVSDGTHIDRFRMMRFAIFIFAEAREASLARRAVFFGLGRNYFLINRLSAAEANSSEIWIRGFAEYSNKRINVRVVHRLFIENVYVFLIWWWFKDAILGTSNVICGTPIR